MQIDSDLSENNVKVSVNTPQKPISYESKSLAINGAQTILLKHVNKPMNNSIIFLGDCEMPITKSETRKNSGSASDVNKTNDNKSKEIHIKNIHITSRQNGDVKQQHTTMRQHTR